MPTICVNLEGDGAFSDLQGKEDKVIHTRGFFTIATLENGMESGEPSAALRFDLPDGTTLIHETSVKALLVAANLMRAKYGFPE